MPIKLCPTRYSNNKLLCSHIDTVDLPRGQSVSGNVQNHQKGPSTKVQLYSGSLTRLPRFTHCCSLGCFAQCLWHDGVVLAGRANMENSGQEKVTRCGGIRFNHKGAKCHLSCCILGVLLCWAKVLVHIWKRKGWSFRWEKQVLVGLFRAVVCFQVGLRGCQRKNERRQRRHKRHILLQRRRPLSAVCFFFDIMDQLAQQHVLLNRTSWVLFWPQTGVQHMLLMSQKLQFYPLLECEHQAVISLEHFSCKNRYSDSHMQWPLFFTLAWS